MCFNLMCGIVNNLKKIEKFYWWNGNLCEYVKFN